MAVNNTFSKLKSSLDRGITTISVKTSSSLEKAKVNTHIESLREEIRKLTYSVGETTYSMWASGEIDPAKLETILVAIREKEAEIESLNQELTNIDERAQKIFGSEEPAPAAPATPSAAPAGQIVCPNCGTIYETAVRFCRKCGQQLG